MSKRAAARFIEIVSVPDGVKHPIRYSPSRIRKFSDRRYESLNTDYVVLNSAQLEGLRSFRKWKRNRRNRYLMFGIMALAFCVVYGICLFGLASFELTKDSVFALVCLVIFAAAGIGMLVVWGKSFSWTPVDVHVGTVIRKSRSRAGSMRKHERNCFYITVQTEDKKLEGLCQVMSYRRLDIGDSAAVFKLAPGKIYYAVHLD